VLTAFGVPLLFLYEVGLHHNVLLMCDAFGLAFLYGVLMVWVIEEVVRRPQPTGLSVSC
jgi:hypothetical protein